MSDQAAPFQPGREQTTIPFRARSEFAGYRAFGSGDDAMLMDLEMERRLRAAAEFATQQGRVAGGLLFGRGWTDGQGRYLVIDGFLEAGPGGNRGDQVPAGGAGQVSAGGAGQFTLPEADLRRLRAEAARMYPGSLEVGWWRTLAALGEFNPRDFATQAQLVGPDGVGLLVYGSGIHWGTAYLGRDGHAPDTAGTLVMATDALPEPPPEPAAGPGLEPGPELVDIAAGEHLAQEPILLADDVEEVKATGLTPAAAGKPLRQQAKRRPRGRARRRPPAPAGGAAPTGRPGPAARRAPGRARVPLWGWVGAPGKAVREAQGPEVPEDVRLVAGAIAIAAVVAAVIVGVLLHSLIVTVLIAAIVLLVIFSSVWLSRR
jgi:hypothetical protein